MHDSTRRANPTNVPVMMSYDWQFIFAAKWWQTARRPSRAKTARDASAEASSACSGRRNSVTVNARARYSRRLAWKRHSSKGKAGCERVGSDCATCTASNNSLPEMWSDGARSRTLLPTLPYDDAFRLPFLRQ
jgi:hypothetical protein